MVEGSSRRRTAANAPTDAASPRSRSYRPEGQTAAATRPRRVPIRGRRKVRGRGSAISASEKPKKRAPEKNQCLLVLRRIEQLNSSIGKSIEKTVPRIRTSSPATMRSAAFSRFTRRSLDRTGRPAVHTPAALFVRPRGITEVPRAAVPAGRRREPCSGQDENRQAPYLHRR